MWSIAAALIGLGIRFLRFAWLGSSSTSDGWVRAVLLGVGFFFPGFIFSLPLTLLWANHRWPGEAQSDLPAIEVSLYIGVAAAVICCIVLLKRRKVQYRP
jgi:hypothetical protein